MLRSQKRMNAVVRLTLGATRTRKLSKGNCSWPAPSGQTKTRTRRAGRGGAKKKWRNAQAGRKIKRRAFVEKGPAKLRGEEERRDGQGKERKSRVRGGTRRKQPKAWRYADHYVMVDVPLEAEWMVAGKTLYTKMRFKGRRTTRTGKGKTCCRRCRSQENVNSPP